MNRLSVCLITAALLAATGACSDDGTGTGDPSSLSDSLPRLSAACVMSSVCLGQSLSGCVGYANTDDAPTMEGVARWSALAQQWPCLSAAKDCDDYWKCVNGGAKKECDNSHKDRCEGNTLVACSYIGSGSKKQHVVRTDCALQGGKCLQGANSPKCGFDACKGRDELRCSGDTLLWCLYKKEFSIPFDCTLANKTCAKNYCVDPGGASCTKSGCDGAKVKLCSKDGAQYTGDCGWVSKDFVCYEDGSQLRCGMPKSEQSCQRTDSPTCDGSMAKICVGGRMHSVDCASFMSATCKASAGAVSCVSSS